jgi:integrase/recombinase XerD
LQEVINDFLFHCRVEKNLSEHTLKAYKLDLKQFREYLTTHKSANKIEHIDKHLLREYIEQIMAVNKVKTVKRKIATLKALFSYLEFEDRIVVNPFRKMRIKLREPLQLPRVMTLEEIKTLFQVAYREKREYTDHSIYSYKCVVRDIVVLELLFATGIRVSELCNLKKEHVDLKDRFIKVNGKGSRERVVQICNKEIIALLNEYLSLFHPSGTAFKNFFINRLGKKLSEQSVRFMVKKYADMSNIKKSITPHMFRHTFATLLLEEAVDIRYIQQLLGHSTITTTQIYTHITHNKQEEILAAHHPRKKLDLVLWG